MICVWKLKYISVFVSYTSFHVYFMFHVKLSVIVGFKFGYLSIFKVFRLHTENQHLRLAEGFLLSSSKPEDSFISV